jgi:hypothetical protein
MTIHPMRVITPQKSDLQIPPLRFAQGRDDKTLMDDKQMGGGDEDGKRRTENG